MPNTELRRKPGRVHGDLKEMPFTCYIMRPGKRVKKVVVLISCHWDAQYRCWLLTPRAHQLIERVHAWWMGKLGIPLNYPTPKKGKRNAKKS